MKQISAEEVKHIAKLANLSLTEEEIEKFREQLSEILSYVEKLREVNTRDLKETSQITGLFNVFRKDEVDEGRYTKKGEYFKTKAIF